MKRFAVAALAAIVVAWAVLRRQPMPAAPFPAWCEHGRGAGQFCRWCDHDEPGGGW